MKLNLGDVVSCGWSDGYADGTVCQVHMDGTVDVFRPFVHASDFSTSGSNPGSIRVACYVGTETVNNVNPDRLILKRKGGPVR